MNEGDRRALLPSGLRDVLPPAAAQEAGVVERLISLFELNGYERVKAPLVEFEEGLLSGAGAAIASETFRLMDPCLAAHDGGARRHHPAGRAHRRQPAEGRAAPAPPLLCRRRAPDQRHPSPPRTPVHPGGDGADRLRRARRRCRDRGARRRGADPGGRRRHHGRPHHAAAGARGMRRAWARARLRRGAARGDRPQGRRGDRGAGRRARGHAGRAARRRRPGRELPGGRSMRSTCRPALPRCAAASPG